MLVLQERERAIKDIAELIQYGPINANLSAEDLSSQNLTPAKGEPSVVPPAPEDQI
jgi:hypothetical protein